MMVLFCIGLMTVSGRLKTTFAATIAAARPIMIAAASLAGPSAETALASPRMHSESEEIEEFCESNIP